MSEIYKIKIIIEIERNQEILVELFNDLSHFLHNNENVHDWTFETD